jgi:hypothetical protein
MGEFGEFHAPDENDEPHEAARKWAAGAKEWHGISAIYSRTRHVSGLQLSSAIDAFASCELRA